MHKKACSLALLLSISLPTVQLKANILEDFLKNVSGSCTHVIKAGAFIGMVGGILYMIAKLKQNMSPRQEPKPKDGKDSKIFQATDIKTILNALENKITAIEGQTQELEQQAKLLLQKQDKLQQEYSAFQTQQGAMHQQLLTLQNKTT